jgi:hypothetical protein
MVYTRNGQSLLHSVADLIDPITGGWDEELIRHFFFGKLMSKVS